MRYLSTCFTTRGSLGYIREDGSVRGVDDTLNFSMCNTNV